MLRVLQLLKAYAPSPASVLVLGESGTGKELAARALHYNSPRKTKPFAAMNCAALNENLLDDEMFGHVDGAFTGAKGPRKGRFEHADGGTLFLDEIGDMPLALQAKLLRVLENGEVIRIGANDPIKVDVRIIAATNKDLQKEVEAGRFRQDLYFRLQVGTVRLPPLREHREDVPQLVAHFLKDFAKRYARPVPRVAPAVWKALEAHDWPGNVRELRNLLDSMTVLDQDGELGTDDFPEECGVKLYGTGAGPTAGGPDRARRPPAGGGGAVLHGEGAGTDRRQPRGGGAAARHQRADHVPQAPGVEEGERPEGRRVTRGVCPSGAASCNHELLC